MTAARHPRIALGPAAPEEFRTAILEAGGTIAEPGQPADALIWSGYPDDDAAEAALVDSDARWVQCTSSGIEQLLERIRRHPERTWTSAKGLFSRTVAEHALVLTLAALRNLRGYARAGSWTPQSGRTLFGRRVLIIGGGGIGTELRALLAPFGARVTVVRTNADPADPAVIAFDALDRHLPDAEVVVLTAPLTARTDGLFDAARFALLSPDAVLVNVARGRLVRTDALLDALRAGTLAAAALDVTDPEPLPPGHPLWQEDRCLVTPHTANTWAMSVGPVTARIAENLARLRDGRALDGIVDPAKGY